jgi:FAD/FMN-containing dehydrogenase
MYRKRRKELILHQRSSLSFISDLQAALAGRVIAPDDPGYDEARSVFHGGIDRRPAVIARPADAADVARVIAVARETGLPFAVRGGGHSSAGHGTADGGIVLDLRDLTSLEVDPAGRTAWAGSGLTAGEYTTKVGAHGLATGFGDTGSVGLGGITLGGGIGYLSRKFGLTIDSLLAAEVVTAAGERLHVDSESHPDLFWALRGGGGNFGVVTRFKYRLHPVDRIVGGMLLLPATAEVVARVIAAAEAAPEELSIIANVMPAPPMPFVPQALHGRLSVLLLMCCAGDDATGAAAIAPFREIAPPLADLVRLMGYPELFPPEDPSFRPMAVGRTMFMRAVDLETAGTMIEHLERSDASMRVVQLRVLGGAIARVPADATAYAHRNCRIMTNVASFYEGPADRSAREAWVATCAAALDQGERGAYVNFLAAEGESRVRAAYPGATWERLAMIKARYDPTNLFQLNQNVPPAT